MAQKVPEPPYQKIIELFDVLTRYQIPYVIVGGAALVLHGIPRSTLDVAIVIPGKKDIIVKLLNAMRTVGLKCQQASIPHLSDRPEFLVGQWITFEDERKRELVDVFLEKESQFKKLLRKSIERRSKQTILHIASLSDLEKLKKTSGRPIDLADLALIQELKRIRKSKK